MYRVVLYGLVGIAGLAMVLGIAGLLPFSGFRLIGSLLVLSVVGFSANWILGKLFRVTTNFESAAITSLILFLIVQPAATVIDAVSLSLGILIALASKYLLVLDKKHLFNPAAVGAVALTYVFDYGVTWWVGSVLLLPATLVVGFLIVRKIRRTGLFVAFLLSVLTTILAFGWYQGQVLSELLLEVWTSWPLLFFGSIMLTEPLTTPPGSVLRVQYAILVGFLFGLPLRFGAFFMTPELALLLGNVFSHVVSPADKLILQLKKKVQLVPEVWEFVFTPHKMLAFFPGQYMEWTMPVSNIDTRGNRRYFTLASAPTEPELKLGVKVPEQASAFKQSLLALKPGATIAAHHLAGEFTLPEDTSQKLVFIAGGIGITPFRSMIQYLLDTKQKRDIILFYVCSTDSEFAYTDIFNKAAKQLGIQVEYVITKAKNAPKNWQGQVGYIDETMIQSVVPHFAERYFYLSGPHGMVTAYEQVLAELKIPSNQIKTDYFPGF